MGLFRRGLRGLAAFDVAATAGGVDLPPVASFLSGIPDGIDGVKATLAQMVRLVKQYRTDGNIRQLAENIVASIPEKDFYGEAEAIHNWVRDNIRYTQDVYDVETLKPPPFILQTRQGDCDDKSLLTATLLQTIGHPVAFVAIATEIPDEFSHVFVSTLIGNRWYASDTTERQPFGWEPQGVPGKLVKHIK